MGLEFGLYHYIFLGIFALLSLFLVTRSDVSDKLEHYCLTFFLLTGNFNEALTFKVPGVSLFEIQPIRFLFLLLSFYIFRKLLFSKERFFEHKSPWKLPAFMVFLFFNMAFIVLSLFKHTSDIGFSEVIVKTVLILNFAIIIYAFRILLTPKSINLIGKTIVIAAIASCILSFIQVGIDPVFMRVGDFRAAFGAVLRANGMFHAEYTNGYFMITAIIWMLATMKNNFLKYSLIIFLCAGVFLTFHRMSWLILAFLLISYFLVYERPSFEIMSIMTIGGLCFLVAIGISFYSDIMQSDLVQERLTNDVDQRKGYYTMVWEEFGNKPFFGHGSKFNPVYYKSMMEITGVRARATGEEGGIHNGYLAMLFYYGLPAFLCALFFWMSTVWYFGVLSLKHLFFSIPLLFTILFMFANLTNTFTYTITPYLSFLLSIHIGIGWSARFMREFAVNG